MNSEKGLSFKQVLSVGILTELTLILFQFLTMKIYLLNKPDALFSFTSEYMRSTGFYVFLIGGFILYLFVGSYVVSRISEGIIKKLIGLIVVAGVMEMTFYLSISAAYEGVFWYSIFSKVFATAFGVILFNVASDHVRKPESYF
jgi:hypothetical protein